MYQHPEFNPSPFPWSSGTIALAKQIGIKHPRYPDTRLYHIPTIDILATVQGSSHVRAVAFAVKPSPNEKDLSEKDAEKLHIQMAYCKEMDIPWKLIAAEKIQKTLSENLKILINYSAPKPELDTHLKEFTELLTPRLLNGKHIIKSVRKVIHKL